MNRTDLQNLADVRIAEAVALLAVPLPDGAYYLAGYAVECALKACIAKTYRQHDWPDKQYVNECHTHDLLKLLRLSGSDLALATDAAISPLLGRNWDIVKDWTERSRYERHSLGEARMLVDAVTDNANGILPWIKARW